MEKKSSHLRHREEQEQTSQAQTRQSKDLEFATAEEVLRYDATQTSVPPAVAERLQKSLAQEPKLSISWWQRLFR